MKSQLCLAFILLLTALLLQSVSSQKKLVFVQELFRHGARYPIFAHKGDMSDYVTTDHIAGQLTVNGKNMHYLLGKKIYQQYWTKLFAGTTFENAYNATKFYFKTTDVNRTYQSAQSHLMGIFDSLPKLQITRDQVDFSAPLWPGVKASVGDVFPTANGFHPLPVHSQKLGTAFNNNGDFLRSYSPDNCPNQNVWLAQNQQTKFVQQIYNYPNFTAVLDQLSIQAKQPNVTFQQAGQYYDSFECSLYAGRKFLPIFTDPKYKRDLEYIYMLDLFINLFYSQEQIRPTSAGFFEATLYNINRALNKKDIQWVVYSAHDTTVGNMLAAMNMTNVACIYQAYLKGDNINNQTCVNQYPGFSANIIFQVYQDNVTSVNSFKIKYNGEYRKIPFCDYSEQCTVDRLQNWYDNSIKVDSFAASCGLYNEDKQFYKGFAIIQFGIILGFLIYWVMKHLKRAKHDVSKPQSKYNVKQISKALAEEEVEGPYK